MYRAERDGERAKAQNDGIDHLEQTLQHLHIGVGQAAFCCSCDHVTHSRLVRQYHAHGKSG
jgi:hypothetical protein